jgi:hypothetical protein
MIKNHKRLEITKIRGLEIMKDWKSRKRIWNGRTRINKEEMIGNHQRRIGNQTKAERARQLARLLIDKEKLKNSRTATKEGTKWHSYHQGTCRYKKGHLPYLGEVVIH